MATVIWAAAAEVIIMDGAEDAAITTAGHAGIIVTITDTRAGEHFRCSPAQSVLLRDSANSVDRARTTGSCQQRCRDAWAHRIHAGDRHYAGRLFRCAELADPTSRPLAIQRQNPGKHRAALCRKEATTGREACGSRQL